MPVISVIVPVYNVEKYLERCLDSIINQTLKDVEIICVNDGSTDNSINILKEYSSQIIIVNKENGGLSDARNKGLDYASAPYIAFVDSDDWIEETAFEEAYSAIEKYKTDFVCFGSQKVYEDNVFWMMYSPWVKTGYYIDKPFYNYFQRAGSIIYTDKEPFKYINLIPIIFEYYKKQNLLDKCGDDLYKRFKDYLKMDFNDALKKE